MGQVRLQVQVIARSMLQLGEDSQKIGGIIEIIDEISDQTKPARPECGYRSAAPAMRASVLPRAREVKRLAGPHRGGDRQIKGLIGEIPTRHNKTIMVTRRGPRRWMPLRVDKVQFSFAAMMGQRRRPPELPRRSPFPPSSKPRPANRWPRP